MASPRTEYGLRARPSDGIPPRKVKEVGSSRAGIPRPANRIGAREMEIPVTAVPGPSSQPKLSPSRAPQASSTRQTGLPQPSPRLVSDSQPRLSGSASRHSSSDSNAHIPGASCSSPSGQSYDGGLESFRSSLRKKSSVALDAESSRNDPGSRTSTSPKRRSQGLFDLGMGAASIQITGMVENRKSAAQLPLMYPELDRYRNFRQPERSPDRHDIDVLYRPAAHDLSPPTPASTLFSGGSSQVSAISGSPSTKPSESPGQGPYSRDTTPTSMSSQSPTLVVSSRLAAPSRGRLNSPTVTRPPVTRRRAGSIPNEVDAISADPHGLDPVRESTISSSSGSTVRDSDKNTKSEKASDRRLPPPPPSPPPRDSFQRLVRSKNEKIPPAETFVEAHNPIEPTQSLLTNEVSSHLRPPSPPKSRPPTRPSRDGTPDMPPRLFGPIPVIQSNLSSIIRSSERRGSEPVATRSLPGSTTSLLQANKNASASQLSGRETGSTESTGTSEELSKGRLGSRGLSRTGRASSPKVGSTFRTFFPFFGRKKAASESPKTDENEPQRRAGRKGPAAGTGHEGYGRVGAVRRRSGGSSNGGRVLSEPQSSQDSLASSDSFLADRVNPVIIYGGEVVNTQNTDTDISRVESNTSSISYGRPSTDSKASPGLTCTSQNTSQTTLWPSATSFDSQAHATFPITCDGSGTDGVTMQSTLAFRRSAQRLRSTPDNPLRLPQPIITDVPASELSTTASFDTSITSGESHIEMQRKVSRVLNNSQPEPLKSEKKARSRRWKLFSRSQSRSSIKEKSDKVQATVTAVDKKPVPFYAMMDTSERDESEPLNVRPVLQNAQISSLSPRPINTPDSRPLGIESREGREVAKNLKSHPSSSRMRIAISEMEPLAAQLHGSQMPSTTPQGSGRPSRLPQVGRKPQIARFRGENISPQSFSRPLRASLQMAPRRTTDDYGPEPIAKSSSAPTPPTVPGLTSENSTADSVTNYISSCRDSDSKLSSEVTRGEREFLAFSPRKDSEGTIGTSSSSSENVHPFADATAVIPEPEDAPAEDDIWDEYNDLLGDEHAKGPQSVTSSKGTPFHLEAYHTRLKERTSIESATIETDSRKTSTHSKAPTNSNAYSADLSERIRAASQSRPRSGFTPDGMSNAGKRNDHVDLGNVGSSETRRNSLSSGKTVFSDCSATTSSDDETLSAQVNLRVGSMTVSKWLTFGHVLFSDIRHELAPVKNSLKRLSILVIDGLGNDDWAFYAAETYPGASFYNLSPRIPLPAEVQSSPSSFPLSPRNHHQVQYMSHLDKFPFAPQSFNCLVYRFPVAAPESYYRNIIGEARRVLRPGGYIELSILDVDLNNMGNRGRRTVRCLKERIHGKTAETRLASTADLMVRLLGNAGFSNIKAARVGIPVASSITRPHGHRDRNDEAMAKKDAPSLAEMMRDNSPMADESITKIVTRVGRWWYTRCYESVAGSAAADKSIWADKALLSECEGLGTSLKLMVCCARAPDRVASL